MRGLGLVALLVVVALILIFYAQMVIPVAKTGQQIKPHVQQLAGTDETGRRVSDSYTLKSEFGRGLRVVELAPSSAMRSYYGLEKGDLIVEVSARGGVPMTLKETDADMLKTYVAEAYQVQQPLVVERNGQRITLPVAGHKPTDEPRPDAGAVTSQLEAIQRQGR